MTTETMLGIAEVMALTGLPRTTLYERMAKGRFPQRERLGDGTAHAVMWREADVLAWLDGGKVRVPAPTGPHFRLPKFGKLRDARAAVRLADRYGVRTRIMAIPDGYLVWLPASDDPERQRRALAIYTPQLQWTFFHDSDGPAAGDP